jgi:preprotein translocase subunit SecE
MGGATPVTFIQETISELRKSVWPSREETARLTAIVIALSLAMALFLGGLDRLLDVVFGHFIL